MNEWVKRLLCRHAWKHDMTNLERHDTPGRVITVGFKECPKCGASRILFIYGNR